MEAWLIIMGALVGGLFVLQGFSKAKANNEQLLDVYEDMLKHASEQQRKQDKEEEDA
jgi:hypothetical protein